MTNQIISRRLSLANNPDEPIIRTDGGGFFSSETDLFLQATTSVDGKARKQLTEEEKKAQDEKEAAEKKEAEKKESDKIKEKITSNETYITNIDAEIKKLKDKINEDVAANPNDRDNIINEGWKKIKELQNEVNTKNEENKKSKEALTKQLDTEKKDAEKNAQSALSNNLSKIDVLPLPNLASLSENDVASVVNVSFLKIFFAIYCLNDESFFDRMKNDAFNDNKGKGTLSHPLPIKYNFKILGSSGIRRGDTFNIVGIPIKYQTSGLFQVTQVEHQIEGVMWTTEVTGEYRQQQ